MISIYCSHCGSRVFFQNTICLSCSSPLAFDLDSKTMVALQDLQPESEYIRCKNYSDHRVCNWAVKRSSANPYCSSCQLTEVIPNLESQANVKAWAKIEEAKRRLIYNLWNLGLRPAPKTDANPDGLSFRFLANADLAPGEKQVLTGHASGVITLNIAEANNVERERIRAALHEPYRTLLGHMRHEIAHYYWDRLIAGSCEVRFRELFGDERLDYGDALERHYTNGAPADWSSHFISAYAASHAWEDWAETWAHYLHMMDSLGTAHHSKLTIAQDHTVDPTFNYKTFDGSSFESLMESWDAVACLINTFNRGLGMPDAYPFAIPKCVREKLRFIHNILHPSA